MTKPAIGGEATGECNRRTLRGGRLRGWANYFGYGYPRITYREINRYTRERLTRHVRRRSQRPFRPPEGVSYDEQFKRMGLVYLEPGLKGSK